ncbi:MAG: hypothetical protein DWQ07_24855 [Chloroflexi bacterium]|nr:MAG: hypothetical protein DWQ07_24855 [Chloroflexota bacterium]MBL1197077.1 hypothetical protein [Chloroflexota bacterium]NOH14372.1 hypothetical protein [Chloroflexota bacterium]
MVGLAFPKSKAQTYQPPQTETAPYLSTIDEVLASISPAPSFAALVGSTEDGVPILFDLASEAPGSLLMASDELFVNRQLLRSMLLSVIKLNSTRQANFHLVSERPAAFYDVLAAPHSLRHFSPADPNCEILIEELCNLVCLRRDENATGPAQILVVDSIDRLMDLMHPQYIQDLMWLLEFGPAQRVYVFAGYDTASFVEQHVNLIEAFETRALGRIFSRELAVYLADFGQVDLQDLHPGEEVFVRSGSDFLRLSLPRIDS